MKSIESVLDSEDRPSAIIGSPLPSEALKAPWRPKTAGRVAFFFGPVAVALVVATSLRRMGHQQSAKKFLPLALGVVAAESLILALFIPVALSPFVGLGAEIAFLFIFPSFLKKEFSEWQATHPSAIPSNGWNAIGWGVVGAGVFLFTYVLVFFLVAAIGIIGVTSKTWNNP